YAVIILVLLFYFFLKELIWKSPLSSPSFMHLTRIDLTDSSISLLEASCTESETLGRERIESICLSDMQFLVEWDLLVVGFRARPDKSIIFSLDAVSFEDSLMLELHP